MKQPNLATKIAFNSTYKCRLLITFANTLEPDQARDFVGPDRFQTV